ncbi:hypothetical protein Vretimale_5580 [Volvox reticuliferus]|uniref:Pseudouridine synthase RsuA/RluA-like domain-containing protein n=1 Tax=Volvox reticuliferus TaxID=1737510 RepID=A0A8J4G5U7_9CHLO|nr:hypothetical protein Vretifemale_5600 [Volvox reticuliferus]GIM00589.1 hypothetical protein Vretimale_5580 [Volvox reticuliferus]
MMLITYRNYIHSFQRWKCGPYNVPISCARGCLARQTRGRMASRAPPPALSANGDEDEDDGEAPVAGKAMRVERLLANLGYGKRRECQMLVKKGRVTTRDGGKLKVGDKVCWGDVVLDGEDLDSPSPLLVALHKPVGYVVTSPDDENIPDPVVYDLLPYRFARRRPFLSCVGRLDKDTSGLLLLTDDGTLLHRINSPRRGIWKVYVATLANPMTPKQADAAARKFASGSLILEGDYTPLLPAKVEFTEERTARVAICEGRYHQVRRMFAAVGHKVVALHRVSVGGLSLGPLPEGEWRYLTSLELQLVFEGPSAEEILGTAAADVTAASAAISASSSGGAEVQGDRETITSTRTSSSGGGSGGGGAVTAGVAPGDGRRLTKKEKKKGPKRDGLRNSQEKGRAAAEEEEDLEGEEEDVADFELLPYDSTVHDKGMFLEEETEDEDSGLRRSHRRQQRRGPTVRQGTVQDARAGNMDEQLDPATYGISYGDEAADVVMSSGAGGGVRKYRDGARWRRRRDALRQMLPS